MLQKYAGITPLLRNIILIPTPV